MSDCCVKGFQWDGTPEGKETKLAGLNTYVTGSNDQVALLLIHDLFGWTFTNVRVLADQYAREINATVYVPDFFGGEVIAPEIVRDFARLRQLDMPGFLARNSKLTREGEIVACAKAIRATYTKVGAIGFCFGGWAVFRLGAKSHEPPLVDCISTAHPSMLENDEIENVGVPVQILAPEVDPMFSPALKEACNRVIPAKGLPYDYQFFPSVEHGFGIRGNPGDIVEREAMVRAIGAAVSWFKYWLHVK
ncbi:Alpha/Beta hydrolase protein [Aspergillus pseudoustus]|uniref:Alpha/Beta hydrolase protein n=1 Tax=Aspergillus pseudoustus TaxID=1810923 RepID=A0ABR4ICR7_9EURO